MELAPAAPAGEIFTRGGPNAVDKRGQSMVAKHLDKLQKEKEKVAMEKLKVLLPQLTPALRAVALQECNWDADRALSTLRQFQVARAAELSAMQAERRQHEAGAGKGGADNDPESEGEGASSDASSGGSSGGDSPRRKRRSSAKKKRSSKDERKRSRRDGDEKKKRKRVKDKDKERELRHKEKDSKRRGERKAAGKAGKAGGSRALEEQYGRYGLIRETDAYAKRPEFALWTLEVKNVDVEALPKFEEREMFRTFMEDYNTATLPHRKFYDLEAYEREKAAKAAARGGGGRAGDERVAFDDEAERRRELEAQRRREQAERLQAAYMELKTTDKAEQMRQQEMMRAKMALAYRTGDQKEAARLAERLKPDDQKAPAEAARQPRDPATGT